MITLALLIRASLGLASIPVQSQSIESYVQADLRDATFSAEIISGNQQELRKINKDFGMSYRFKTSDFYLKEPLKVRVEAKVEDSNFVYVINGPSQEFKYGGKRISKVDLTNSPGKRQSTMDFGILTPSLFESFLDSKFVGIERATGESIFDLTYKQADKDKSRFRVWLDKEKKLVTKREWYSQEGQLRATFRYSEPVRVDHIWFSTHLEVINADNVVAGVTAYTKLKFNTNLPDSLFDP